MGVRVQVPVTLLHESMLHGSDTANGFAWGRNLQPESERQKSLVHSLLSLQDSSGVRTQPRGSTHDPRSQTLVTLQSRAWPRHPLAAFEHDDEKQLVLVQVGHAHEPGSAHLQKPLHDEPHKLP